jgi:hypothetical protein
MMRLHSAAKWRLLLPKRLPHSAAKWRLLLLKRRTQRLNAVKRRLVLPQRPHSAAKSQV